MRLNDGARVQISTANLEQLMTDLGQHLSKRIKRHGDGAFASHMEARGVIDEEAEEFADAAKRYNVMDMEDEAWDVAVAGLWAVLSVRKLTNGR